MQHSSQPPAPPTGRMPQGNRRPVLAVGFAALLAAVAVVVVVLLTGGGQGSAGPAGGAEPSDVQEVKGSAYPRVVLTARAAQRIGLRTASVRAAGPATGAVKRIPYAAVLYDPEGRTFTYANPRPLVFVRTPISVRDVRGGMAELSRGPAPGTRVVEVGAAELLGAEYGVEE